MDENIVKILTSPNLPIVIIGILSILVVVWVLARTGYLTLNTNYSKLNLSIGSATKEREIIRHQVEWIRHHLEGVEAKMDKPEGYDEWRGKFIIEKIYDEYVDIITFNHISTADTYVSVKQDLIVDTILKYVEKDFFKTKKFENIVREDTKYCIETLTQIREMYNGTNK